MEEKILTKNPDTAMKGRRIDKAKYDVIRTAILKSLKDGKELTHTQLEKSVRKYLKGKFSGDISWHHQIVKRDLEARKIIKRITKTFVGTVPGKTTTVIKGVDSNYIENLKKTKPPESSKGGG